MRDLQRIDDILDDLKILWKQDPDLRLCQILSYLAIKSGYTNKDLFYIEDDKIHIEIKRKLCLTSKKYTHLKEEEY